MSRCRTAGLLMLLAAAAACRAKPGALERPNVLVVTIDTIRADHVGAYGSSAGATPAIDAFAREGLLFEQAIAPAPLTLPSHTTLFSGILPFRSGVRVNAPDRVPEQLPLLAEAFSNGGYRTAAFVSSLVLRRSSGIGRGFALYDDAFLSNEGKDPRSYVHERRGEETVARALSWIAEERAGEKRTPFFAWVHLYDPHAPYEPPEPYAQRFRERPYAGEIAYADACFGRLREALHRDLGEDRVGNPRSPNEGLRTSGDDLRAPAGLVPDDQPGDSPRLRDGVPPNGPDRPRDRALREGSQDEQARCR